MYDFIDVTETSEGNVLPSEALKINGEYIENLIPGYRTLNVQGREALSPDVLSYTTGSRDGSRLQSKRYPERIITVTYQIAAESNEAFREAYNKLGGILDVEDAELIFNDEQDKFFVGTPCVIDSVEPGRNAVVGNFEILCTDPFKYSVVEYEAEPDLDESCVLIDYNGTYKAFPTLEADFYSEDEASDDGETVKNLTGAGECGYVAFFTEDEKIVQIGDPDEDDGENAYAKSQTLTSSTFNKSTSWGSAAKKLWTVNNGVTSTNALAQVGTMAMAVASYATPEAPATTSGTLLSVTSKAASPHVKYTVKAKATNRTANSVKVTISITAALTSTGSYWKNAGVLINSVYIGGAWRNVTMKAASDKWASTTGHTKNITVTVSGLAAATTALSGIKFRATRSDSIGNTGILSETACNDLKISPYESATPETYYLSPSSFGSGTGWHGASITRTLPADASGEVGATNFTLTYAQKMSIGNTNNATNQRGAFQVILSDANGAIVAGVNVYKSGSGKKGKLRFIVNGSAAHTMEIDLSHNNKYFNSSKKTTVTKSGKTVTFNICGIKKTFRDEDIASAAVTKITVTMSQYGSKTALAYNGLYSIKFVKNNCDTWKDIPNRFSAGDVVEADCRDGAIYLNGVLTPSLGALGNDWEDFVLTPGLNQIGVSYSDWVSSAYAPTMKVRYREVFL